MNKVLFSGSREWKDEIPIWIELRKLDPFSVVIIHGDCRGLDRSVGRLATCLGFKVYAFPAKWKVYDKDRGKTFSDKGAGLKRNKEMVDMLNPMTDKMIAFRLNKSPGTSHAISLANKKNIEVIIHDR